MEETGCHIHFPDSNRTSALEKSNQVSIAGDMERVERARARVRALTPLVFCFELPIVSSSQPLPDINSPYVQQIQEQYNVQIDIVQYLKNKLEPRVIPACKAKDVRPFANFQSP
ncbi:unnamed protein product [Colias eurytheme]|nr:unnamed protein product [Colias eurytheme]